MSLFELKPRHANHVLASLPQAEWGDLTSHLRPLSLEKGAVLYQPGGPVDGIYFPDSGLISIVTPLLDGHTLETAIVGKDSCAGAIETRGSRIAFSRAICQSESTGMFLPAERLHRNRNAWSALSASLDLVIETLMAQAQQSAACHGQHTAESRLCRWLLTASDRTGAETMGLTQQFMGDMLGVQRTTVTLVASQLQAKGWIRYTRGNVRIIDREAMMSHACECYSTIRRHEARVWDSGQAA